MSIESGIQPGILEKKDVMALLLVREAVEFPIVLQSDTQSVYCSVARDKLGKLFVVENKPSSFNDFILRKR